MNIIKTYFKYKTYIKAALVVVIILAAGVLYCCKHNNTASDKQKGKYSLMQEVTSVYDVNDNTDAKNDRITQDDIPDISQSTEYENQDSDNEESLIYVYLYGEVSNPGVVACRIDSRVYEVVQLCGGYTQYADVARINPVQRISDGAKIYIPKIGEEYNPDMYSEDIANKESDSQSVNVRININTASKEQLVTLPGIGDSRAGDIISYRSKHGGFKSIEDIKNVPGIKDGAFSKIKDYICV